jgi:hypothetical protein
MEVTNSQKEQFSLAYIRAVASVAGYYPYRPEVDINSVDLTIAVRGSLDTLRQPKLDVQAKCTARDVVYADSVHFPLDIGNYNDLRAPRHTPCILIVVTVPPTLDEWLVQTEEQLILRHCAYWVSLLDAPATGNETTITVNIPTSNVFSPGDLRAMMRRIDRGDAI